MTTTTRMAHVLKQTLSIESKPDARLITDLRCDSLDLVELTMATEEEFGITISDAEMALLIRDGGEVEATVRDWIAFVEVKLVGEVA